MATVPKDYAASGTLADLNITVGGDEDFSRAKLISIQQVEDDEGNTATRATYERVPSSQPYIKKVVEIVNVTNATASELHDITVAQLQKGRARAFDGTAFIEGEPSEVAVFRQQ